MKYNFQYLTETKISAFPVIIMILIFLGMGAKAVIKIKEIKEQAYYLELHTENENELINIKHARKNK